MFWLVDLGDVLFAGFSAVAMLQLSVGGRQCRFQKGFRRIHSRLALFPF